MISWEEAMNEAINQYGKGYPDLVEEAKRILRYYRSEEEKDRHNDYLNSQEWREKRDNILKRDEYKCVRCKGIIKNLIEKYFKEYENELKEFEIKATQVHHTTYENLHTSKEVDDCISLCWRCHKIQHSLTLNKLMEDQFNSILKNINSFLCKTPKSIERKREQNLKFKKSITLTPIQFLNEVENGFKRKG
jgi:5-methylcytosine-specific restriction endonuclease McrA